MKVVRPNCTKTNEIARQTGFRSVRYKNRNWCLCFSLNRGFGALCTVSYTPKQQQQYQRSGNGFCDQICTQWVLLHGKEYQACRPKIKTQSPNVEARSPKSEICIIYEGLSRYYTHSHCTFLSKNTEFQPRNLLTYLVGIKPDCDRYLRISKQLL